MHDDELFVQSKMHVYFYIVRTVCKRLFGTFQRILGAIYRISAFGSARPPVSDNKRISHNGIRLSEKFPINLGIRLRRVRRDSVYARQNRLNGAVRRRASVLRPYGKITLAERVDKFYRQRFGVQKNDF